MSLTHLISSKLAPACLRQATLRTFSLSTTQLDKATHTGQQFTESDQRNARFAVTGLEKQVNTEWAIDLIAAVPPQVVNKRVVCVILRSIGWSSICYVSGVL
jgi:hypothetical protein